MTDLPANVYRLKQRDFTAIPRESWVYWIGSSKCSAGVSRSPTIAIAVLHELVGYPLVEASRTVINQVRPSWASLCRYYGQSVSVNDVWRRESTSDDTEISITDARRN